jgi:hypothetical protein
MSTTLEPEMPEDVAALDGDDYDEPGDDDGERAGEDD